ncbi:MAG: four helix bundle protein [Aggregatilineales bacterium]
MQDFRNLQVWEKSHALVLNAYKHTQNFPQLEQYGLTSQIRRAAASIPANIAEGCGKTPISSLLDICKFRWDQQVNLNIIYYLQKIWDL